MRIAFYQPEQAGNVGTIMRLAACLGVAVDIIEPCGFPWGDKSLKRAGMDYAEIANGTRHDSWDAFVDRAAGRLVLLTTRGGTAMPKAEFRADDILLLGSESAGVPSTVHDRAALRVRIPQATGTPSFNLAFPAGIGPAESSERAPFGKEVGRTV